ncbi:ParB/RepB/Spo0J family partition protein [Candidatus Kaiserbacteria bacterium]|nr:ParB/RepB/Spo0J family partition protein [Candidatus Kaiserbacteria bacterium]
MEQFYNNSIFWVEVHKIKPNPFQPRKEFNQGKLEELADSIRQYGVLQPLVVTRHEIEKEDGGLATEYELIAGERRLRASRIAGLSQVPVIIRTNEETDKVKLELAIIENLQREDLNSIDRALAFKQLVDTFGLKHGEVGKKVGKSREYVSNTLRLLLMPEEIQLALQEGKISEGHARPILMLTGKDEEQHTLFKEILYRKLTVREAESIARHIAQDRIRKKEYMMDPELIVLEKKLTETLGTRVQIEQKEGGGRVHIDYFTVEDLRSIFDKIEGDIAQEKEKIEEKKDTGFIERFVSFTKNNDEVPFREESTDVPEETVDEGLLDDRSEEEKEQDENDEDLYSVKNFSI